MKLDHTQKVKLIMSINLAVLFVMIVITPRMIEYGIWNFTESFIEGCFLAIEVLALFLIFRHFEVLMEEKEKEFENLDLKLQKREKELLNTFQYLGKMNVQFSMFKTIFEKVKVPSTRNELKDAYADLLKIICSIAGKDCVGLRLIELDSGRTVGEFYEEFSPKNNQANCFENNFGNKDLINIFKIKLNKIFTEKGNFLVVYSEFNNFDVKAFIYFNQNNDEKFEKEEKELMEAIANQCEIFFLLFTSNHCQKNKNSNKKIS